VTLSKRPKQSKILIEKEKFLKISDAELMPDFFMSITSSFNHWIYIDSNGSLSAEEKDSKNAIFPFYENDNLIKSAKIFGNKGILRIETGQKTYNSERFPKRFFNKNRQKREGHKDLFINKILFKQGNFQTKKRTSQNFTEDLLVRIR